MLLDQMLLFNRHYVKSKTKGTIPLAAQRALFIINMNQQTEDLLAEAVNIRRDQMMVIKTFGFAIFQPYGCMVRNILMAVYQQNVNEVFLIGDQSSKEASLDKSALLSRIREEGIEEDDVKTVNYLLQHVQGQNVHQWLVGSGDVEEKIKKNVAILRDHPLLPKRVSVYGLMIDLHTGKLDLVSEERSRT